MKQPHVHHAVVVTFTLVGLALALSACEPRQRRTRTTVELPPQLALDPPAEVQRLRSLAMAVQTPGDIHAEADAIKRLRHHMSANNLTYDLRAFSAATGTAAPPGTETRTNTVAGAGAGAEAPIASPSMHTGPLRVIMEIFRGRESLYTFTFTPRDNRNLALLGQ